MLLENWVTLISSLIMVLLFGTILGTVLLYGKYKKQNSAAAQRKAPASVALHLPVRRQVAFR
ncbi:MAG: hypothetical protein A2X94_03225 [Bdellovibrionales bacterium GWB1_55_8]|nr:MAG: hypothetical protein A2X94_03225 [Bdellovibrionales bacterium GWB1_55_8]